MNLPLPQCVTMPSQFRNERVSLEATAHVPVHNVAWILAHLTARLKCIVHSRGNVIREVENSSGIPLKEAFDLVTAKKNDGIIIRHCASKELGGVVLQRVDESRWVMDTLPAIARVQGVGEVKEINHICRELFLSIKHATKLEDGIGDRLIIYRQPIYYHPRFDNKDFDPSYFTVD